jgi:hypothetical protein
MPQMNDSGPEGRLPNGEFDLATTALSYKTIIEYLRASVFLIVLNDEGQGDYQEEVHTNPDEKLANRVYSSVAWKNQVAFSLEIYMWQY